MKAGRKGEKQKRKGKSKKTKREKRQERGKEKGRNPRPVYYSFVYRILRIPLLPSQYVGMLQFFRVGDVYVFFV